MSSRSREQFPCTVPKLILLTLRLFIGPRKWQSLSTTPHAMSSVEAVQGIYGNYHRSSSAAELTLNSKTTTMLFKMLGIENAWVMHSNKDMAKPRQLFVTQSRVLAGKVEEYFSKLMESLATATRSPKELAALAKKMQTHREDEGLVDLDDEVNWRNDLPDRFSHLQEKHFPLFITFDRVNIFSLQRILNLTTMVSQICSFANFSKPTSSAQNHVALLPRMEESGHWGHLYPTMFSSRHIGHISHKPLPKAWVSQGKTLTLNSCPDSNSASSDPSLVFSEILGKYLLVWVCVSEY